MDLLDTILRSCDAEKYINNFKENGIDSYVLKILGDEDLQVTGVYDPEVRARILEHCQNLQIPTERKRDLTVDNQFLTFDLSQINMQINKHYANLSYALQRKDVDMCYIRIRPAVLCLENCLDLLDSQVQNLEMQVLGNKPQSAERSKCPVLLFGTISTTAVVLLAFVWCIKGTS